ncbi:type II secretion system protein [Bacillus sp. KH172YL63]|uniref:type II secretion system protein n=1 Tax=Bacillus sp. KH172YL63 TaxID=2709784 RepID=UPI0013E4204E|nr:type II secretion system protein [Bacillus sp. KH172YL63]BCB04717.1 hypothetical protein KH172YL63_28500 [Bacillus sp. KH172YL63]
MYRNSNGFSLPESLVAFSCVLLISGIFIPFLIQYAARLEMLQHEVEALKFLREGVEGTIVSREYTGHARTYKGVRYEFMWRGAVHEEACVQYSKGQESKEVCISQNE